MKNVSPGAKTLDIEWMQVALEEAALAACEGEVPVGAVIVKNSELVAKAHNRREGDKTALAHAEILAIDAACKKLGGWRLWECEMYVTLEPCPMCAGAIINSRIRRLVWGAWDPKAGCCSSVVNLFDLPFNHHPELCGGVLEKESKTLLSSFFKQLRNKNGCE